MASREMTSEARWQAVVSRLSRYMSEHQVLAAPRAAVGDLVDDAEAMVEERVLVHAGDGYAFFHETFFDFTFARDFAARDQSLTEYLLSEGQELFRRAQVRQILTQRRAGDFRWYARAAHELLADNRIRFHIQDVVFSLFEAEDHPRRDEWLTVAPYFLDSTHRFFPRAWRTLMRPAWFGLLDSMGDVERWLNSGSDDLASRAVDLMRRARAEFPDRVAELCEPHVGEEGPWPARLRKIIELSDLDASRRYFDLVLSAFDAGTLDASKGRVGSRLLWFSAYSLPEEQPEWACELLATVLRRAIGVQRVTGAPLFGAKDAVLAAGQREPEFVRRTARNAPDKFVELVLPLILEIAQESALEAEPPPRHSRVWRLRYQRQVYGIDDALLAAAADALAATAKASDATFSVAQGQLLALSDLDIAQWLLFTGWTANPDRFAQDAGQYLIESTAHLRSGYADSPHWTARELIAAASPFWPRSLLEDVEERILSYHPSWELDPGAPEDLRGYAQWELLSAVDPQRRSPAANAVVAIWERRTERPEPAPPMGIRTGSVQSPISETDARALSDDGWLAAMQEYVEVEAFTMVGDRFVGGAEQLARVLERLVKEQPERFARLAVRFPDDVAGPYVDAVLLGLADAAEPAELETVLDAVRRLHALPERPAGRWLTRVIAKRADEQLPADVLDLVAWYAVEDPDPETDTWKQQAGSGAADYGGDPYSAGINSVRGAAAEAMTSLLYAYEGRVERFRPALERLVDDPTTQVRACAAQTLTALLRHDRDEAAALFVRLTDTTEDRLLTTPTAERFLAYAVRTHFAALRPILERMLSSHQADIRQAGARLMVLSSLVSEDAEDAANVTWSNDADQRRGAAEVYAANVHSPQFRAVCEGALANLFNDDDATVRTAAAACFRESEDSELGDLRRLIRTFIESRAFVDGYEDLLDAVESSTAELSSEIVQLCDRFIRTVGTASADIQQRAAGDASTVSQLIVRAYAQAGSAEERSAALDVIDELLASQAYGLSDALSAYER